MQYICKVLHHRAVKKKQKVVQKFLASACSRLSDQKRKKVKHKSRKVKTERCISVKMVINLETNHCQLSKHIYIYISANSACLLRRCLQVFCFLFSFLLYECFLSSIILQYFIIFLLNFALDS